MNLAVGSRAQWFSVDGAPRVTLSQRRVLRALLDVLVKERLSAPGVPVSINALAAVVWENDRSMRASIQNRLCVAMSSLRKMGLEGLLLTKRGKGYLLDPNVKVEREPPPVVGSLLGRHHTQADGAL